MKQDKSNAVKSYKNRCSNYFITDREIKEILKKFAGRLLSTAKTVLQSVISWRKLTQSEQGVI
ncbi:hypothetical protein [Phascolarctobacterium sp.]